MFVSYDRMEVAVMRMTAGGNCPPFILHRAALLAVHGVMVKCPCRAMSLWSESILDGPAGGGSSVGSACFMCCGWSRACAVVV